MILGIDFFGVSEEEHRALSMHPAGENKKNSFAEFNRELGELNEYMDVMSILFKIREKYMEEIK